ncbi:MAG: hypothetical protein KAR19_18985 [Bacteroidales bacterium]|nr:hypothetical protein [Bacteroidales bacterium]
MNYHKIIPIVTGAIKHLPGVKGLLSKGTGGTIESRYCYSVWMRHLYNWNTVHSDIPKVVAELGPGDSLGIGFAALLSGCTRVYAFDAVKYLDNQRNLKVFNEIVDLFKHRADIPDNKEYPNVRPEIDNHGFPNTIISESQLKDALSNDRLDILREEIIDAENPQNQFIKYQIPWNDSKILEKGSVDFIYSQAVLEHVEDLEYTYIAMSNWLKPMGLMSHTIDFKSHGVTNIWNGHWTFSDFEWRIVKGGKSYLINRQPFSYHIYLHTKHGYELIKKCREEDINNLSRNQLADKFQTLTDNDLTTSGMYILSQKGS